MTGNTNSEARRKIVVVGASAGGVEALSALFERLPDNLQASFFVVLHISPFSVSALHQILAKRTGMRVVAAENDEAIVEGTVYVGSADRHLMIEPGSVRLTRGPKESRARPAVDVLFRSAATAYGPQVVGVVLTGALDDGSAGLWAIKDRGGLAFVQDPKTAEHSSMPESAIKQVDIDFVGDIDALATEIVKATNSFGVPAGKKDEPSHLEIENAISINGGGMEAGIMALGAVSKYTCPDCHGVLVQINEGRIVRFRCHTGHAFSMQSLIAEINESIDDGLWTTLRAIEERVMLLRQMADRADDFTAASDARSYRQQADEAERRLKPLRELVLDSHLFGHNTSK